MHELRNHWTGDKPTDLCWADRDGQSASQTPCNRVNVGQLGLCPMHEAEIAGVDRLLKAAVAIGEAA